MQKLTGYSSSLYWYVKLGHGIISLAVACHIPKVTKNTGYCHQRPNTPILPIFGWWLRKMVVFSLQSFNAKTDWLSFLFVLVCETWPWYFWFSHGMSYPKSGKKGQDFVSSAQTRWFCQFLAAECEKLWIFVLKVLIQKLTGYPSSSYWYVKLGCGITGLAVALHFPKVTKRTKIDLYGVEGLKRGKNEKL